MIVRMDPLEPNRTRFRSAVIAYKSFSRFRIKVTLSTDGWEVLRGLWCQDTHRLLATVRKLNIVGALYVATVRVLAVAEVSTGVVVFYTVRKVVWNGVLTKEGEVLGNQSKQCINFIIRIMQRQIKWFTKTHLLKDHIGHACCGNLLLLLLFLSLLTTYMLLYWLIGVWGFSEGRSDCHHHKKYGHLKHEKKKNENVVSRSAFLQLSKHVSSRLPFHDKPHRVSLFMINLIRK